MPRPVVSALGLLIWAILGFLIQGITGILSFHTPPQKI